MDQIFLAHYQIPMFGGPVCTRTSASNIFGSHQNQSQRKQANKKTTRMKRIPTSAYTSPSSVSFQKENNNMAEHEQPTQGLQVTVKHLHPEPPTKVNNVTGHSSSGSDTPKQQQHHHEHHDDQHHDDACPGHHSSCSQTISPTHTRSLSDPAYHHQHEDEHQQHNPHEPPAYAEMPPEMAQELVSRTETRFARAISQSPFLQEHASSLDNVRQFTLDDNLIRGALIATGGFAAVYQSVVKEGDKSSEQYVIKHIAPKLYRASPEDDDDHLNNNNDINDQQQQQQQHKPTNWYTRHRKIFLATKDLLLEAHLLAGLNHPNILSLHGVSAGGVLNLATTNRTDAFYLVLPKLVATLEEKLEAWKLERMQWEQMHPQHHASLFSLIQLQKRREESELRQERLVKVFRERLQVAIDLFKALEYLHTKRIMHRDIKPANIGFDEDGCLKLLDFGLAKELPPEESCYTGSCPHHNNNNHSNGSNVFALPGNTGTSRYMAPEIINRLPYNCKVDVYSATITLWQCLALRKPFGTDATGQFVKECVAIYGDRPNISRKWPKGIRKSLQLGWARDIPTRPSSSEMRALLEEVVEHPHKLHSSQ